MSRNSAQWLRPPAFPPTHYVHTGVYTDPAIFREEQSRVFDPCWIIACHESEIPNPGDYRTFPHPGGTPLFVVRGPDGRVRSFYNICPHRGNTLLYEPSGNVRSI